MPQLRFSCLFLVACSSSPITPGPDAGKDAMPDPDSGVLACPKGTALDDSGSFCASTLTASRSMVTIAPVRDHHSTTILQTKAGTFLYVFAGTDAWTTIHDDVQRARIADDGSLGAFEVVSHLPAVRAGQCIIVKNNRVTLLGGTDGHMMIASSVTAAIDPNDGTVGAWTSGPDLPEPVMHESCDAYGAWVYAVGGRSQYTGGASTATVGRAPLGPDGMIGKFEKLADLPVDRSHHQSFSMHDRLYVFGGITGNPVGNMELDRTDMAFAPIASDGTLGDWQNAGDLAAPLAISNATVFGEAVYSLGGLEKGSVYSANIRRLTLAADGTLASDVVVGKIMTGRGHVHNCPMNGELLYSVGGHDNFDKSLGTVDIVKFSAP
jgi:hypothetical protein